MSESSLRKEILRYCQRKISFHGGASKDVLFAERVVLCYRCKTRHMLGENCPVAPPTLEGSDISHSEQSETPQDPPAESQQKSLSVDESNDEIVLRRMDLAVTLAQGQLRSLAMEMTLLLKWNRTWNLWETSNYHILIKNWTVQILSRNSMVNLYPQCLMGRSKLHRHLYLLPRFIG